MSVYNMETGKVDFKDIRYPHSLRPGDETWKVEFVVYIAK